MTNIKNDDHMAIFIKNSNVISIENIFEQNNAKIIVKDETGKQYICKLRSKVTYNMLCNGLFAIVLHAFRHTITIKTLKLSILQSTEGYHYLSGAEIDSF
ncbi:hypothetical protein [Xenorhabdus innexi]|uniref:Uncharacterized protein n=1 Tax=Xenorhabdus innexi TaxID=290109 RepID=A0A1N6MYX3_9GAMM|nr:hypothetical protein [Xenorhabdus innexi]PHM31227.1 hypothetical protein Xinn_02936 [Xenorhabdus innexi]SIP74021.1 hypothetical protein XIS1_490018 [Xenorhabdus innexi]